MSEITLTGGTLVPTPSSNSHSHSHSHGGQVCNNPHHHGAVEMITVQAPSMDDLINASPEEIVRAFSTLLRFGRFEALQPLFEQLEDVNSNSKEKPKTTVPEVLQTLDEGGHSLFHWAAKRVDDIRFLQLLVDKAVQYNLTPQILNINSQDNVGMRPLHWAATEGSIPHTAIFLKHGADMEAKDNSGCTPLLIAAQYGQVEVVAYLLKKGANIQAVDTSWDSALHWAAYKGSIHVCGLLAYYQDLQFTAQDAYGQTPLHLAALRGHTSVVRYILQRLKKKDVLFLKDKNERTPLDLAIHKNRPTVEAVLREAMASVEDPRGYFLRKTLWSNCRDIFSPKAWKTWMGLTVGMDEMDEPSKFPFYFVCANFVLQFFFLVRIFAPFFNAAEGLLWDKAGLLLTNFVFTFLSWYFFYKTVKTPPGYLDDSLPDIAKWRRLYEETLESYADENAHEEALYDLCHTCHVARPLRSKHCRVHRKCVLLFDHFCPFVDNTIGLYNYWAFYSFLVCMTVGVFLFMWTLVIWIMRYRKDHGDIPWVLLMLGLEICLSIFPIGGLCFYHTQLSAVNLSTNEHLNVRKYKYLYPPSAKGKRQYKNPWFKGYWGNIMDRMCPSKQCYEIPHDHEALISGHSVDTSGAGHKTRRIETV
ncbi:ankyrin repeat domain protein [Nitzschia inconspicua]|uniref:Palmitoyltransferase n=1 Tax=Nitzschia inconspicua TaxID=303405 RepID=A0A9K3Q5L7_9STRA|nr:ankyrin repeat domain protein [Nitzschia inconspicua]